MIKVEKDITMVPESLIPAFADLFPGHSVIPVLSRNTHEKRMIVINAKLYYDTDPFNNRYKVDDIRTALVDIYKNKCAFCEQRIIQYHIEHYRPKKIYYWLAFSWDNLLLACPTCNQNKGINFELEGAQVLFSNNDANVRAINHSSQAYDLVEFPKMVNPEITDPLGNIKFNLDGSIESDDIRFAYTIRICKINSKDLNDNRRRLLDRVREHLRDAYLQYENSNDREIAIETIIRGFVLDSSKSEEEYLAFRRYALQNKWLNDIIKDLD